MEKYHVSVAAEAYAAAAFARAGYEVSVQYGANQPGYDLVAIKGQRRLLVSVKGSQDGGWVLHGRFKKNRTWSEAVDKWRGAQSSDTIMFFVQFQQAAFEEMPRMYLARVSEVADHLLQGRAGNVSTCLMENYQYSRGLARGHTDTIPKAWRCSVDRIESV
jgi:hypothetical protein